MYLSLPASLRRIALATALLAVALFACKTAPASAAVLDLEHLDGPTAIQMMEKGELTSVELTQAYIDRIEALNADGPGLNAVSQFNPAALREARKADELRAEGKVLGPAMGLPILLKDLIDVTGMYTSAGNWSLRDSYPATDSGVAKKLRENGVVILGKLGLSEYANYFGRQPSGFGNLTGQVVNGIDADQNPSGSSSGSGAAGAAALSMLTIGTETSGSIISPSRTQGLVGLRPTVGLVAGYGIAPIVASQDTAGPMDRTVANAALTLQSIAGPDPINDAYYEAYWAEAGLEPSDVGPPAPATVPNYLSALDLDFVKGKRIGYNGSSPEILEAKQVLEDAGAILVERPVIDEDPTRPSWYGEMHNAIDRYYERLGPDAPINSLQEEVDANQAEEHFALKFGNVNHTNSLAAEYGPGTTWEAEIKVALPEAKQKAWAGIDRMMENDTPGEPNDDFIAILGTVQDGATAGYPQITIPMGYNESNRRTKYVYLHGNAYTERDLLGVAYVIEQGTKLREPAGEVNPSMYRCADTVPAPPFAGRGGCNPDHDSLMAMIGGTVPELSFPLETTSAAELEEMMEAGELTAEELTKAYLARIAAANTTGPAIQAVRSVNPDALAEAAALDAERQSKGPRGPLHGIPVLLDDGIDAAGLESSGGAVALQGSVAGKDSRIVTKLKKAGAIILGKANVTELNGMFSSDMPDGYSSLGGQVMVPSDTDDSPFGSAAGSTAATAAGMAAMAVGLETSPDTAQLVRPAGVNGVVGLKPTVGRVGRTGVMPVAKSQDSPGPIAQTVTDAATQLQVIAGADFQDPATAGAPAVPDYLAALDPDALEGETVAVVDNSSESVNTRGVYQTAVTTVTGLGATTALTTEPSLSLPNIATFEFKRDFDAYLGGLSGGNADTLAEVIAYNADNAVEALKYQQGELLDAAAVDLSDETTEGAYEAALETGEEEAAEAINAVLTAETPETSDDRDLIMVPYDSDLVEAADLAGYPVLSVPGGYGIEQMGRNPVGVVFIAAPYEEAELLGAGYAFESGTAERQAPSFTNPSMWRCVALSEFYSPEYCRPGTVEPLAVAPGPPAPEPPVVQPPAPGGPKLTIRLKPKKATVGPRRKFVAYTVSFTNRGDTATGKLALCAKAPQQRLKVVGKACRKLGVAPGETETRTVQLRVRPAAAGKVTKIRFKVLGPRIKNRQAMALLRVKRG